MNESVVLPNFIGIGGKKCATTWLAQCLRSHPEIFLSTPKELNFFNESRKSQKNMDRYLAHFKAAGDHRAIGEFSTTYLSQPATAAEMAEMLGEIKIIVSLRNPIDRFLSDYTQSVLREQLIRDNKNSKLKQISNVGTAMLEDLQKELPVVFDNGKYYPGLNEYIRIFGQESVLVLIKEEIDENPKRELAKLYRFLEVDPGYVPPMLHKLVSPGIVPRYAVLEQIRSSIFLYCHRKAPFVIDWVRKLRLAELYRRFNASPHTTIELQDRARAALGGFYAEDVNKVQALLGHKINAWTGDFK